MLRNAVEGGRVSDFSEEAHYEDVRFNVISVTEFPEKSLRNT